MAWLWWMSFCTIETLKTNLQFSLHSAHPKDLIVKGGKPSGAVPTVRTKTGWRLNKICHNSMLVNKTHQLLSMLSILESKKSIPKKAMNFRKNPSGFWPPRCRLPFFGSKAKLSPPNRGQLGSLGLFNFSLFSFDSHKSNKMTPKKTKNNSIYWFVDQLCLDISSLWLIYLISPTISAFSPFTFLHLFMIYNTRNTRTPEISIDEGLESWSPCRARPISHRFCLSQTFSANLFSFTEELSARTACSQQQRRRIKNKISEASSSSLASTRLGDGVWVSIMHESVPYSTYYIKSWNT